MQWAYTVGPFEASIHCRLSGNSTCSKLTECLEARKYMNCAVDSAFLSKGERVFALIVVEFEHLDWNAGRWSFERVQVTGGQLSTSDDLSAIG